MEALKPSCFEDLIALLALYRPGPLGNGMADSFIARKHGREPITYPHQLLEDCLRETYGVIVYQEQVMQIAQIIAGYSLGEADILRRAMGKKKADDMAREQTRFLRGARESGLDEVKAKAIFGCIQKFAEYGFNKSHSAAYALLTYRTAWLKAHYPAEFMAALMTSASDQAKLATYLREGRKLGLEFLTPDVNESGVEFIPVEKRIRWGLAAIKGVGQKAASEIRAKRSGKPYESVADFCARINKRTVNGTVLTALVKAGACDAFGTRKSMLKPGNEGAAEYSEKTLLKNEREVLGLYLSRHPLDGIDCPDCALLEDLDILSAATPCAVIVTGVNKKTTKKGEQMAFVRVEDRTGADAHVIVWPKVFAAIDSICKEGQILKMTLSVKADRDGKLQLICEGAEELMG